VTTRRGLRRGQKKKEEGSVRTGLEEGGCPYPQLGLYPEKKKIQPDAYFRQGDKRQKEKKEEKGTSLPERTARREVKKRRMNA